MPSRCDSFAPCGACARFSKSSRTAVHVEAGQLVQAVRVVFMRVLPDGQLDVTDAYSSDWIGVATGQGIKQLGGTGALVLGVHGRRAAVLDAFGLVMAPTDD